MQSILPIQQAAASMHGSLLCTAKIHSFPHVGSKGWDSCCQTLPMDLPEVLTAFSFLFFFSEIQYLEKSSIGQKGFILAYSPRDKVHFVREDSSKEESWGYLKSSPLILTVLFNRISSEMFQRQSLPKQKEEKKRKKVMFSQNTWNIDKCSAQIKHSC